MQRCNLTGLATGIRVKTVMPPEKIYKNRRRKLVKSNNIFKYFQVNIDFEF